MNAIIRPLLVSAAVVTLACLSAGTAVAADPKSPKADVPRPPGMDDPGVTTDPSTAPASDSAAPVAQAEQDPLAPLPKPDARLVRDKASRDKAATDQRAAASDVTTRKQGNDTVEEYREHGHIWMVRIVPQNGPTQTFYADDGSGRLVRDPREGPVSPVYYTLYSWK